MAGGFASPQTDGRDGAGRPSDSRGGTLTEMLQGDVIAAIAIYDYLDPEIDGGNEAVLRECPSRRRRWLADDSGSPTDADGSQQHAGHRRSRQPAITGRPDADVRRDVLRALLLDSFVPLSVDAQVNDGVVTLTGTVSSERERKDATYLAGCVPGVIGVLDHFAWRPRFPRGDDGQAARDAVAAALASTAKADLRDLTVDTSGWGTVVLSGVVQSRSDHDLAIATAMSVADVDTVDDCIQVEN